MALATSKRKFYKLLDNLSTTKLPDSATERPSTSSTSERPSTTDRPIKRGRMIESKSFHHVGASTTPGRSSVRVISSTFGGSITPSRPRANTTTPTVTVVRQPAAYAPWSHEQFLARMQTFADVKTWSTKPEAVGEVVWAKRGWAVVGADEVGCKSCGKHVVVNLDGEKKEAENEVEGDGRWWMDDADKKLIERYQSLVVEGHDESCLWRKSGCKDDIYRIKFSDQAVWQKDLAERYISLMAMEDSLPTTLTPPKADDRVHFDIEAMSKSLGPVLQRKQNENGATTTLDSSNADSTNVSVPKVNTTAMILALCGWTGKELSGVNLAYCPACFSRIGLWIYNDEMKFNPVTLHRIHCPWQNASAQSALGIHSGLAAWQVLTELVYGKLLRSEKSKESLYGDDEDDVYMDGPRGSVDDEDMEDRAREGKLARLKRAFTVKRNSRKSIM